jgi:hypothetical protein
MFILKKKFFFASIIMFYLVASKGLDSQTRTVDNSKFVNQSVPDRMAPDETYQLIVTFENIGTTPWVPGEYKLKIASDDGSITPVWSISEIDLEKIIESGNTASFELKVTAPSSEGVYSFKTQLLHGSYVFGETSKPVDVTVTRQVNYKEALNSSAFVEQTIPSVMEHGKTYKVMISMTNTGKTVWTPGLYRLVMLDAAGKAYTGGNWNKYSVSLDENISPGGTKVFNFEIIPLLPGTYTVQWRMASSETGLFGDATNPKVIKVNKIEVKKNQGRKGKE